MTKTGHSSHAAMLKFNQITGAKKLELVTMLVEVVTSPRGAGKWTRTVSRAACVDQIANVQRTSVTTTIVVISLQKVHSATPSCSIKQVKEQWTTIWTVGAALINIFAGSMI